MKAKEKGESRKLDRHLNGDEEGVELPSLTYCTNLTTILKTLLKEFDKQKIEGGGFKIGNKYVIIEVKESE